MVELLLRAATGPDGGAPDGGGRNDAAGRERRVLFRALSSMWVMEMIEMLRGHTTNEEIQSRLEVAADRLLAGL
jgi:hypothetical protein